MDPILSAPDLRLTRSLFLAKSGDSVYASAVLKAIKENAMAPYYRHVCSELGNKMDDALLKSLTEKNDTDIQALEAKIKDAEENLGESELAEALLQKAQYLAKIGDKELAITAYNVAYEKTVPVGTKIDILFGIIRIGFFYNDNDVITKHLEKVKSLIEKGGDWDRRNRMKAYEGIFKISIRDFSGAVDLFVDTLAAFSSVELVSFKDFVRYAVLTAAITLNRPDFKKKIVNSPEILEVVHEMPELQDFIVSLFNCQYEKFFKSLAAIEQSLKLDYILHKHTRFYVREMRIIIYSQLLESYRSLTLESMAKSFGVSEEFIDSDLPKFISAGRVGAIIDKVAGIVETNRPNSKNAQYNAVIKQGDLLLNRIQKLSRVINV